MGYQNHNSLDRLMIKVSSTMLNTLSHRTTSMYGLLTYTRIWGPLVHLMVRLHLKYMYHHLQNKKMNLNNARHTCRCCWLLIDFILFVVCECASLTKHSTLLYSMSTHTQNIPRYYIQNMFSCYKGHPPTDPLVLISFSAL